MMIHLKFCLIKKVVSYTRCPRVDFGGRGSRKTARAFHSLRPFRYHIQCSVLGYRVCAFLRPSRYISCLHTSYLVSSFASGTDLYSIGAAASISVSRVQQIYICVEKSPTSGVYIYTLLIIRKDLSRCALAILLLINNVNCKRICYTMSNLMDAYIM